MHIIGHHAESYKAVVFCEGMLGDIDGKTANGLVRSSDFFDICAVIDSRWRGSTADKVVPGAQPVPVVGSLSEAMQIDHSICWFVYGKAPLGGVLPSAERVYIHDALARRMHVVSGLLDFLSDDKDFCTQETKDRIHDIRKPPPLSEQRLFSGVITAVEAKRILVTGTDCAQGKRTTATILYQGLQEQGVSSAFVATGQTGVMQGARYGVCLDALPIMSAMGAIENVICKCWNEQRPDVIIIEGQSSASHPALVGGTAILKASRPHAIVMQDTPGRISRVDYPDFAKPDVRYEIALAKKLCNVDPIAITLNPENLDEQAFEQIRAELSDEYELPCVDPIRGGVEELVDAVKNMLQ